MSFHGCLVVQRESDWLVVVGSQSETLASDVSAEELVTCVSVMLKMAAPKNTSCVLAPASTSAFFATLRVGPEIELRDRAALTYELEDHLPVDAESMVADFVVAVSPAEDESESVKTVAAVAIEVERWRVIADAFETAGIPVRCIVPSAVLATRSVCRDFGLTETVELLLVDQGRCDLITVASQTIVAWKHLTLESKGLQRHKLLRDVEPSRVVVVGADETQQTTIRSILGDIEIASGRLDSHVADGGKLALAKDSQRWFDLRREQLGPSDPLRPILSQIRLVALAVAACLLAMVLGGWWRKQRIESKIADVRQQQQQRFQQAFPNTKVPPALVRRVRSEHTRVIGSRGASSLVDLPQSAPEVLHELLAALPETVRFRLRSIKILNGKVDLDMQVRSPVDAGVLATSLSAAGFDVEPPVTTQQDARTFDSVLEARWLGRPAQSQRKTDVSVRLSIDREAAG